MELQQTVEINAPPEKVWPIMFDVLRWPRWTASVKEVRLLDAGEIKVGTHARIRQPRLPSAVWRLTQLVPNSGFVWESDMFGAHTAGEHWITCSGDGRSIVLLKIRQTGFAAKLLSPLTSGLIRRYINMEAQGLKKACEISHAPEGLPTQPNNFTSNV